MATVGIKGLSYNIYRVLQRSFVFICVVHARQNVTDHFRAESLGDGATVGDGRSKDADLAAKQVAADVDDGVNDQFSVFQSLDSTQYCFR